MLHYLVAGAESKERIDLLFSLTRIESDNVKSAVIAHLNLLLSIENAAELNEVESSSVSRALKRLDKVAGIVTQIEELDWLRFKKQNS